MAEIQSENKNQHAATEQIDSLHNNSDGISTASSSHAFLGELAGSSVARKGLPSNATFEQAQEFFSKPFKDAGSLPQLCQGSAVCSIGEDHTSLASKDYVAQNIEGLAKAGYTFVGFEMALQSDQSLLDDYMGGKASRDSMINLFRSFDWEPGDPEEYVKILDAMKDYNQKTGAHMRAIGLELPVHGNAGADEIMTQRDHNWAQKIDEIIQQNPGAKIVTYSGAQHVGMRNRFNTVNQELSKLGLNSTSISFDSNDPKDRPLLDDRTAASAASKLAKTQEFSYPIVPGEDGEKRADFGVFIPWMDPKPIDTGKDVTSTEERGKTHTEEFELRDVDPDGKLLVTSDDTTEKVIKLEYKDANQSAVISPTDANILPNLTQDGWKRYLLTSGNYSFSEFRNGKKISAVELTKDGKLMQIRANPGLIYVKH